MGLKKASQKGPSLLFWRTNVREGRGAFRLGRCYYSNLTIKLILEHIVYAFLPDLPLRAHTYSILDIARFPLFYAYR